MRPRPRLQPQANVALKLITAASRFDVISSDLTMPKMMGMDFYRELTRFAPLLSQFENERIDKPFRIGCERRSSDS